MRPPTTTFHKWSLAALIAIANTASALAQVPSDAEWVRVEETDRAIKIETDKLEAVIPKKDPKHGMTGIEKGSFSISRRVSVKSATA